MEPQLMPSSPASRFLAYVAPASRKYVVGLEYCPSVSRDAGVSISQLQYLAPVWRTIHYLEVQTTLSFRERQTDLPQYRSSF